MHDLTLKFLRILGGEDADAPSAETLKRLRRLQKSGHPITVAVFPHAEHGIYEFDIQPDGSRVDIRNPDGYFRMMRDYILTGHVQAHYGNATVYPVPRR